MGALADVAQTLAEKKITGKKSDPAFRPILAHYTNGSFFHDRKAFRDLYRGWCAAFVYHCSVEAGLGLPPRVMCKERVRSFAGVLTWLEWGERVGFIQKPEGFSPQRGDIVIYNGSIPVQYRERNAFEHDHIGIVLGLDGETLMVAEGNVDRQNVGGIITRKRGDACIGCYLRFPEGYVYKE
ncbi:MAG: CHAP domain-containing protein [Oscillospiraceae bacterium]|nr:CHAP domain-containing protein [Oscillospiraceae bacterium]